VAARMGRGMDSRDAASTVNRFECVITSHIALYMVKYYLSYCTVICTMN